MEKMCNDRTTNVVKMKAMPPKALNNGLAAFKNFVKVPRTLATLGDFCHLFPVLEKLLAPLHLPLSNGDIGLHINFSTDKQHRKVHFPTYSFELLRLRWCSQRDLTLFIKNSYFFLFVAFSLRSFVFTHITFIDILLLFLHNLPWFV